MIVYTKDDMIVFMMIFTIWWSNDNDEISGMMIPLQQTLYKLFQKKKKKKKE